MKDWLKTLLSELHKEYLKPLGFRKVRATFTRVRKGYDELFNFQGSSWSSGDERRFYLNVGIAFHDLKPYCYMGCFPTSHWAGRVEDIITGAPKHWDCDRATDRERLKAELHDLVAKSCESLTKRASKFRAVHVAALARQNGSACS